MHNYFGQDSAGLSIGAYIAGKGYWVTPNVTDDSNDRDAANYSVGVEAVADRTVWIGWRMVNGLEGGTYPGGITWNGAQSFGGLVTFTSLLAPQFSHGLSVLAGTTVLQVTNVSGAMNTLAPLTVSAGLALPVGSITQVADKIIHTGANAYRAMRAAASPSTSVVLSAWEQDLWIVPTLAASRTYSLTHPPNNEIVEATFYFEAPSLSNSLGLSDGGVFVTLGNGAYKTVTVIYTGTAWIVKNAIT